MHDHAGKIAKAKRYAGERERFQFQQFQLTFKGDNNPHEVSYTQGKFKCDCDFFILEAWCCHSRALELILDKMLPEAEGVPA